MEGARGAGGSQCHRSAFALAVVFVVCVAIYLIGAHA
jgi:hypothetical protein